MLVSCIPSLKLFFNFLFKPNGSCSASTRGFLLSGLHSATAKRQGSFTLNELVAPHVWDHNATSTWTPQQVVSGGFEVFKSFQKPPLGGSWYKDFLSTENSPKPSFEAKRELRTQLCASKALDTSSTSNFNAAECACAVRSCPGCKSLRAQNNGCSRKGRFGNIGLQVLAVLLHTCSLAMVLFSGGSFMTPRNIAEKPWQKTARSLGT